MNTVPFTHGERIGKLTVLHARGEKHWKVGCACGNRFSERTSRLLSGRITECGRCRKLGASFKAAA